VLNHSDLQTTAEGENIPGKSLTAMLTVADAALDMAKQAVKVSGLQLKSKDVTLSAEITGNNINDKLLSRALLPLHPSVRLRS